jgi:hypothetical protein
MNAAAGGGRSGRWLVGHAWSGLAGGLASVTVCPGLSSQS